MNELRRQSPVFKNTEHLESFVCMFIPGNGVLLCNTLAESRLDCTETKREELHGWNLDRLIHYIVRKRKQGWYSSYW